MGHHAADYQCVYLQAFQIRIQFCFQETVRIPLDDYFIIVSWPDPVRYFRAECPFQEECIIRRIEVLDVYDRPVAHPAFGD